MPNPQDIFQLAQQTATQVTASPENWRRFLYTAAHNYHTTYLNQLLIHAQRPDATACATMKYWNEQAHRKVMYGSKSIIILQRHQGVPTAKRVFSMTDTVLTGDKAAAPWEVTDAIRPLLMQVNSVGSLMDRATEQVISLSERANRVMAGSIEDSTLNWSHPEDQRFILQELAAQSTLYMICIRLGIPVREEDFPAFQNVTQFDTSRISLCLGGYVQAAAEPLLDELGHEVMQLARDSVAIQAEPVHNTDTQSPTQTTSREEAVTDDVHERNRIPDSEPELAESQEKQPEPIRQDAAGLLGTERAEPVRPDDAGGNAAAELPQDGAGRTADGGQDAARPDAESADARPQDKPAGLGADVQQPEAAGGGNDPSDAVRSITEEPAAAESEPSPSAFSLPEFPAELLPSLLKADTTSRASNADILSFFSKTPLLIDRLRYIRESYKVVFTELLLEDDTRVGFYKESNGLLVWQGSYLTRSAESHLSWHSVTAAISALVDNHELKQYGVEVYFVNDGIWTMDGDGEVRLTIMASIAQDESRKTSERVKAGQKMSREKGVLYGSGNIIGYDRVDGTYVINEEQAATVRRIFNLYAEGHGETTVAKMLIEENRKDGGGGLSWTASKVSRVLRKPTYKGYMTYNKSHIDDFLSHNRINHSEENFVLVKGNFEPIVSEELWETCNQIRSKRAAFVKGKDGRAHKFGVSFPQNKWTKILFCDCGMRFQIEGYDKTANGGKNMRLICARSKMFKKKDAARALNGIPCPAPYASEWKLELMAREVFRTVWKENAEDILGLLRMLDANLNTTGTPNDGNQLENKLSALNEELDDLVSQRASRSITMDDFLSRSTEINNEIMNVEGLLQSSIQEQRPKARLDMHSIEAALSDDASFPDGKIEPGFLDRYANRIVKSNNRYIWMLQLMNVQQIMPIQSERQPIAMVTYKSGVPYDIEQEQTGKQDKESAGPDCATICRPQDFFLNMSRIKRKRKLVEWLESCQENQVSVLDEKIPLLSFAVDFVTAYEYQKARGIKIHPGLWKDMRVDIFLVKKEN